MKTSVKYKTRLLKQVDSTNAYAMKNLADLTDREVIIADKQTNGKGRLGRSWVSDQEENVYLTIVLKPENRPTQALPLANITQYMAVCLSKVLEDYGVQPEIKWPNDLLINQKKIAGILSQLSMQGNNLKGFILGAGVNLNLTEDTLKSIDQPATSLNQELGCAIHRDTFIETLLEEFFNNYDLFLGKGFEFIRYDYEKRNCFLGKNIAINILNKIEKGIAKELNEEGSLILLNEHNELKTISMGDIICY